MLQFKCKILLSIDIFRRLHTYTCHVRGLSRSPLFQHYLSMCSSAVTLPLLIAPALCLHHGVALAELVGTSLFVDGLVTILQVSLGSRQVVQLLCRSLIALVLAIKMILDKT